MDWVKKIHKWASIIVGIQFLLWLGSGIYFNLMDHHKAGGHAYRANVENKVALDKQRLLEPKQILAQAKAAISINVTQLLGQPYYIVNHEKGLYPNFKNAYSLYDAYTGRETKLGREMASSIAMQSYNGPGKIDSVQLIQPPIADFPKQQNATWQVNFADDLDTSVYIEAGSGRIVGHSDANKRLADIFFMLHFMDYANEGSFNNIPIIIFAFITLWLSFTGLIWTIDLLQRGQYKLSVFSSKRAIKIFDQQQQSLGQVTLSTATNVLDGLVEHGISLPSSCGGGGTCGRCKVLINPPAPPTSSDLAQFSQQELDQGYRLACQHFSNDVQDMTLFDITDAKKFNLTLVASKFLTPDIKELRFKTDGLPLTYKAGAFMRFFIPEGIGYSKPQEIPEDFAYFWDTIANYQYPRKASSRNYSMASACQQSDELVFAIKYQRAPEEGVPSGLGSSYMCNLAVGESVEALGPFEEFYADASYAGPMIFIGAGSGMAPLRAIIIEKLLVQNTQQPIHFYFGARNEEDLLYKDEFFALSQQYENFHFTPVLSGEPDDWLGATGYAQQVLFTNFAQKTLLSAQFYLCGPTGMMDETMSKLKKIGVTNEAIHYDSFL
ncbi:2Fe-2S iron-sulfur cluster-binding protein [Thalassotalea sp. G2M2-11]|uniref:2Fe-2S iron-sulfur cluster-binding protein n=1 Tax=Thalassotalea sp. G2M2-11 TaxID=2787627 RepID=UPI0019D064F8|nr:2Fe-2S iron-sulfur cluster-binding protein [Thalassotalea sp. G2M2-11]